MHRRDPAAKLLPLGVFLVALATVHRGLPWMAAGAVTILAAGFLAARLPIGRAFLRGTVVLPFTGTVALISWLSGDPARALELLMKSYLSALAVVLVVATSPLPGLFRRLESLGIPPFLLMVAQLVYRYLFVIAGEAAHMRTAAMSRGGMSFHAAAGAVAVLFARSHERAAAIHQAMLARGFQARFIPLSPPKFGTADALFTAGVISAVLVLRLASERVA